MNAGIVILFCGIVVLGAAIGLSNLSWLAEQDEDDKDPYANDKW